MTNGHRTDYLPKAVREAERVSRLLSRAVGGIVPVRGVIVVICDSFKVKAQPLDVTVVRRREVRRGSRSDPPRSLPITSTASPTPPPLPAPGIDL